MNRHNVLSTAAMLLILGLAPMPALANSGVQADASAMTSVVTIPTNTAIVVTFSDAIELEYDPETSYPVTLFLAHPIKDHTNNILVPAESILQAHFEPVQDGVKIVAESLIISNQVVPLQASSSVIPVISIKISEGNDRAQKLISSGAMIGGMLDRGGSEGMDLGLLGTTVIANIFGLNSAETADYIHIAKDTLHVLTLEAPTEVTQPEYIAAPMAERSSSSPTTPIE